MKKGFEPIPVITPDAAVHYGQKAYRFLAGILEKESIPHAILFTGIEGAGKRSAALSFAMACNCVSQDNPATDSGLRDSENRSLPVSDSFVRPCGVCKPCRKIKTGNHPDIHIVEPSGRYIRIDRIRDLLSSLDMRPYEAMRRFVIITNVQHMNAEAANSFLKMLEEPPERTFLILTAGQKSDLLPTIVSRCQHFHFNPIPNDCIEKMLIDTNRASGEKAKAISLAAGGAFSRAFELSDAGAFLKQTVRRDWLVENSGLGDAGSKKNLPLIFAFAEKISKNKDMLAEDLDILYMWLRDVLIGKYIPHKIINYDAAEKIRRLSVDEATDKLLSRIRAVESARRAILSNANPRLTVETMLIQFSKTG